LASEGLKESWRTRTADEIESIVSAWLVRAARALATHAGRDGSRAVSSRLELSAAELAASRAVAPSAAVVLAIAQSRGLQFPEGKPRMGSTTTFCTRHSHTS